MASQESPSKKIQISLDPDELNDPIMFSNFTQSDPPITLPCGHSYAKSTFQHLKYQGKCPQCKKKFDISQIYEKNILITGLISKIENSKKFICSCCQNGNPALFICLEDGALQCTSCICKDQEHISHAKENIEEYLQSQKKCIRELEDVQLDFGELDDEKLLYEGLNSLFAALKSDIRFHFMANRIQLQVWKQKSQKLTQEHEKYLKGENGISLLKNSIEQQITKGVELKQEQVDKMKKVSAYLESIRKPVKKKIHDIINEVGEELEEGRIKDSKEENNSRQFEFIQEGLKLIERLQDSNVGVKSEQKGMVKHESQIQNNLFFPFDESYLKQQNSETKTMSIDALKEFNEGNITKSIAIQDKIIQKDPHTPIQKLNKGIMLATLGLTDQACELFQQIIKEQNGQQQRKFSLIPYICAAKCLNLQKKYNDTLGMVSEGLKDVLESSNENQAQLGLQQSIAFEQLGKYLQSYESIRWSLKKNPNSIDCMLQYASLLKEFEYYDQALYIYNRVIIESDETRFEALLKKGQLLLNHSEQDSEAIDCLEKCAQIARTPLENSKVHDFQSQILVKLSKINDLKCALDIFKDIGLKQYEYYYNKARLEYLKGNFREALDVLNEGNFELNLKNIEIYELKIDILIKLTRYQKVITLLDQIIRISKEEKTLQKAYFNKGYSYYQLNMLKSGLENFLSSAQLNQKNEDCLYYIAKSFARLGNSKESLLYVREALRLNPKSIKFSLLKQQIERT